MNIEKQHKADKKIAIIIAFIWLIVPLGAYLDASFIARYSYEYYLNRCIFEAALVTAGLFLGLGAFSKEITGRNRLLELIKKWF